MSASATQVGHCIVPSRQAGKLVVARRFCHVHAAGSPAARTCRRLTCCNQCTHGPADEHAFPTLLAMHGRDNETDCQGWLTGAWFTPALELPSCSMRWAACASAARQPSLRPTLLLPAACKQLRC